MAEFDFFSYSYDKLALPYDRAEQRIDLVLDVELNCGHHKPPDSLGSQVSSFDLYDGRRSIYNFYRDKE